MSLTPDNTLADPQKIIADLREQLDERTRLLNERTAELAARNSELQQRTDDLQQSLEYQTATSDVLKVISRSTVDLQPVLDTLCETAARLCNADMTMIFRRDGEVYRVAASLGSSPEYVAFQEANPLSPGRGTLTGRVALEGRTVHITDTDLDPEYTFTEAMTLGKIHTNLGVPLLREGIVVGTINLARRRVEPYTERQIELVRTFADQAVIAIENARLITETREALEQQTATAEVLGVINSSPGDLAPVFEAMLEKAVRLCGAEFGVMNTFDGEHFHHAADQGVPAAYAKFRRDRGPTVYGSGTTPARLVAGEGLVHTIDLMATEPYEQGDPARRALVDLGGARSHLCVALRKGDILLGDISIYRQDVHPFSDKQIALLQNFATQAVIAMENARLITETREALEQQTATAEVLGVINSSPGDLAPVFDAMLDKALRLCEAAFGILLTFDGDTLRTVAFRNVPDALAQYMSQPLVPDPETTLGRVVRERRTVHTEDNAEAEPYRNRAPLAVAAVELGHSRTVLHVPLIRDEIVLGVVIIFRQEVRSFSDKQIVLLENFATQAVIAMENARLIAETREALEQQTATAEVLQVINSSPGDLVPVFDAMLERATRLCDATFGILWTYDGEWYRAVAFQNVPQAYADFLREPPPVSAESAIGRIAAGEPMAHIHDLAAVILGLGSSLNRQSMELGGFRTVLGVALRKEDSLFGAITIYRQEVRPFSDKQIALLQNFAAQAVIAMENARLITETREALEQQTATTEVLQVINASPGDLAPVFEAMLDKAMRLCEATFGVLQTYDGHAWHTDAARGVPLAYAEFRKNNPPAYSHPGTGPARLLAGERVVHIADLKEEDAYHSGDPNRRALVDIGGARTSLHVALMRDEKVCGCIQLYNAEVHPFTEKQIALLQNFAAQAVIAIENVRLLDEIHQRQAELRVTFDNMVDGVVMFDDDLRLTAWNRNFQELLDLPDAVLAERPSYADYLRILAERGEFGTEDIEAELGRRLQDTDQELRLERTRPDGRIIEVRRNAVPDGGFVLIYSDITERKRSEAEVRAARDAAEATLRDLRAAQANLIQAEKMASLGQLTAGIAHEIKNPLNFVNNFADLSGELLKELQESAAPGWAALDDDKRAEIDETMVMLSGNLEKIAEHGRRADGIVKSMLEHSRGVTSERRVVDLNNLIEEALNLAYHGARAQDQTFNIRMDRDFDRDLARIELVPQEMNRVFINLFGNGFYAAAKRQRDSAETEFQPTLTVATRDLGEAVEVRVRDNGIGIPADIKDKLFQPFFTTKPTGEGTGLGLSISYDIVTQQHGGTITVESEPGSFTEFTIRLPRDSYAASTGAAS